MCCVVVLEGTLRLHSSVCSATFETKGQFSRCLRWLGSQDLTTFTMKTEFITEACHWHQFHLGNVEDSWPWTRLSFEASVSIRLCYLCYSFASEWTLFVSWTASGITEHPLLVFLHFVTNFQFSATFRMDVNWTIKRQRKRINKLQSCWKYHTCQAMIDTSFL